MLMYKEWSFKITADPTKLDTGVRMDNILVYNSIMPKARPIFFVLITVLKPLGDNLSLTLVKLDLHFIENIHMLPLQNTIIKVQGLLMPSLQLSLLSLHQAKRNSTS